VLRSTGLAGTGCVDVHTHHRLPGWCCCWWACLQTQVLPPAAPSPRDPSPALCAVFMYSCSYSRRACVLLVLGRACCCSCLGGVARISRHPPDGRGAAGGSSRCHACAPAGLSLMAGTSWFTRAATKAVRWRLGDWWLRWRRALPGAAITLLSDALLRLLPFCSHLGMQCRACGPLWET